MIAPCPFDLSNIKGGVEAVTVNLLKGFESIDNVELYVVSIRKDVKEEEIVNLFNKIRIHYIPFGKIKSTKLEMLFHGRKKVKKIISEYNPDIIHIQGNGTILLLALGLNKDNIIVTQHGILREEFRYQKTLFSKLSHLLNILTENICMKNIHNIIFISKYNKNLFLKSSKQILNSRLIYNPVNENFFEIPEMKKSGNKLLYVGKFMKRKGLLLLLKAINKLNSDGKYYHLEVVGGVCEKAYKDEVDKFISQHNLNDSITFHDWLSQSKIIELMKKVSILVLPSYQETLPVTIAEAMAARLIVIATDVGGISEMIENNESGFLFEKGNIDQVTNILLSFYENNENIEVSEKARKRAKEMFSVTSIVEQTYEFYYEIKNKDLKNNSVGLFL